MRVVFEIEGTHPQVTGTGHHFSGPITEPPRWRGFHAEVVIADCSQAHDGQPFTEGDTIYIEGNGESIIRALKAALHVVNGIEQIARKAYDAEVALIRPCPRCGAWVTHANVFAALCTP